MQCSEVLNPWIWGTPHVVVPLLVPINTHGYGGLKDLKLFMSLDLQTQTLLCTINQKCLIRPNKGQVM